MIRGSKTVSGTVLKHDLCELVIAEVRSVITNDGTGVPNLAKRDLRNLQPTRASLVGSAFASTHFDKPIESGVKHLLGSVVWAMMSPDGSIVASLENVNGFLAVYTPLDDLIRTDFKKKGFVPEVMLHILEEFVFLLGRHSLDNEVLRMNPTEQSRLRIFLSKEIFEGGMIRIHNAFVQDEDYTYGKVACIAHKPKGKSQSGAIKIGASVNFLLSV
nr:hypothetical protein [Tanacetum cinerariifolium]